MIKNPSMRGSAPGRAQPACLRPASFKPGHEKQGGRKRGAPNAISNHYKKAQRLARNAPNRKVLP